MKKTAQDFAIENSMSESQVIQEIRDGNMMGRIVDGTWYVMPPETKSSKKDEAQAAYIQAHRKSPGIAFMLAVVLGPIGSLYGSVVGGIILILATISFAMSMGWVAAVFGWVVSMLVGPLGASMHNDKLAAKANLIAQS